MSEGKNPKNGGLFGEKEHMLTDAEISSHTNSIKHLISYQFQARFQKMIMISYMVVECGIILIVYLIGSILSKSGKLMHLEKIGK